MLITTVPMTFNTRSEIICGGTPADQSQLVFPNFFEFLTMIANQQQYFVHLFPRGEQR